jgi:DNA-binding MarR family transcriptional regulator
MDYDLTKCIGFVTNNVVKTVTDDFNRRLEKCGSTRIQWIAMYFLLRAETPIGQKELAELMNIKDSSLARLIDRMERGGLIKRIENTKDKRAKFLKLTDFGQFKANELMPMGKEFNDILLRNITNEELENLQIVFNKMLNNTSGWD